MRFLTARLSAKRRSPLAGLVVLLLGLLVTGAAYAVLSPANADTNESDQSTVAEGRKLFLVGCSSCHGQNGEGILTKRGTQYGPPLVGVGAAAVDFQVGTGRMPMARPGVQAARKKVIYTPDEISALAAYVASLGPGPVRPREVRSTTPRASTPTPSREAGSSGAPTARPATTSPPPAAPCHAASSRRRLHGVSEKHMYEAMLTGPQQMPVFSDRVLKPSEKRDVIAYVKSLQESPNYGGTTLGSLGPVSEGLAAWVVGIGALVGFAVWIASQLRPFEEEE